MESNVICKQDLSNEYDEEPSVGHLMIKSWSSVPNQRVIISGVTGEEITAKELLDQSVKIAKSLQAAGAKQGDVISIVSENRFEFAFIAFGTIAYNCIIAPINLTYTEREIAHALNLSKPKIIFVSPYASDKVVRVAKKLSYVKKIILMDDANPFGNSVTLLKDFTNPKVIANVKFIPQAVDKSKTVCMILCSSGTTGLAKGVQLSQANIIVATRFCKNNILNLIEMNENERVMMGLLPWFHAFGILSMTGVLACAHGTIVLLPKFEEGLFLSCIENYRCTILFMVPPLMTFLAKHPLVDSYDTSSVEIIICGAAPLSKELQQAVENRLKNPKMIVRQGYGMSELTLATMFQQDLRKAGSIGNIIEGSAVKVIDETGKALGPNQQGELCFKGNQVMIGYIDNEEATRNTIDEDGWLHTGDVGYYDEDFQFYVVDRIKELIKWKGYQVPPAELEGVLLTNHKIRDAAVIGIPDEVAGELPLAFVVKSDEKLTENEVINFVANNASPAKRLHGGVIFIDQIPRSASGKILRRELRDLMKQKNLKAKL